MCISFKTKPVYKSKKFKLYKITVPILLTSEVWTFRDADRVKPAVTIEPQYPTVIGMHLALPWSRFTATVLIAFEICSFQGQLAISIVSLVLLLWILYCLIQSIFPYLAGKLGRIWYLAHRQRYTLSQICRKLLKTGLENSKIKSNPHHCSFSIARNEREQHQCQHWY